MRTNDQDTKKVAILHFVTKELLDDINELSYVEGDIMEGDDNHAKHQVFDVCEDGNINRVTRMIKLNFSKCVEFMYPYSKKEIPNRVGLDNELEAEDEYVMKLTLPNTFSETTLNYLEELIHEYIVDQVMADWMSIVKPISQKNWQDKADDMETEILSSLNRRVAKVRRPLSPF